MVPRTRTSWGPWEPATPTEVRGLLVGLSVPWWLAGGYAIELAVGRPLREHADIDVVMLRRDHLAVQGALDGWQWWAADAPGVLRPWCTRECLPAGVHDIWCRSDADQPWRIQIMLDEFDGEDRMSRRNPRLRRPVATLGPSSRDGIPLLAPEIVLFYKAKAPRAKDEVDFTAALPLLDADQRRWLGHAIADTYGAHPWTQRRT